MPTQLLSHERRILAAFILQPDERRAEMIARMECDPKTSGPLLHAVRAVLDIIWGDLTMRNTNELLAALERLALAAECRDNTAGDPIRLIEVKAELAAAARHARATIARATGEPS